jgi:DNA-binding response OmpR family regulator
MNKDPILVIDDEPAIRQVIRERLEIEGFAVEIAGSGEEALTAVERACPSLAILDLMLPDIDGFEVLRRLRQAGSDLPVIILTARDEDVDAIVGLELGADDYVRKPFNPRELAARVRAVLRRRAEIEVLAQRVDDLETKLSTTSSTVPTDKSGSADILTFDHPARRAWLAGQPLDLRPREYDLLYFLAQYPGQVFSRDRLLDQVWGEAEYIDDRTVDVHIHRLRHKLAEIIPELNPIQTERGTGYRFEL